MFFLVIHLWTGHNKAWYMLTILAALKCSVNIWQSAKSKFWEAPQRALLPFTGCLTVRYWCCCTRDEWWKNGRLYCLNLSFFNGIFRIVAFFLLSVHERVNVFLQHHGHIETFFTQYHLTITQESERIVLKISIKSSCPSFWLFFAWNHDPTGHRHFLHQNSVSLTN